MDLELSGQTAIITGGASGIGAAIAEAFVAEGARVAVWDLAGPDAVDVTSLASVASAFERAIAEHGAVHHLVHAAARGSGRFGFPFTNLSPPDWPRVLDVNIMGMVNVAHVVTPYLRERRSGTMTFIASVAGQIGSQTDPPYSASKAANINFAQCMAKDLAPHGVRVNTVCPGMVKTPLNRAVWQAWYDQQPPEAQFDYEAWSAEKIRKVVPTGSWQSPEDVANMVVFLASPRAGQVTGQTINVDGGFVMHW
ncbi:MAG: SDR family oxidoreductase [Acidobacteria bacterium]|nr:SDR family oxidoreductase [Acidobacteriota bacterium]